MFDMVERGIRELVDQTNMEVTEKDDDYKWFGGSGKIHVYAADGSAICYQRDNIY